ncbi:MAG: M14 family zinc carboxypeptidase, partial [Armatimonadota bacterium]
MKGRGTARAATLGLSLMVSLGAAQGTRDITSLAEERYDARIPAPEAVLGAPLASRYARAHELTEYIRLLDTATPRVVSVNLGRSYQGREITAAIITSPESHARIKEIQAQNRRIVFDSASVTDEEIKAMPTVMWMGYGVHGNEASTSEAALATLYHLAAGTGKVPALL